MKKEQNLLNKQEDQFNSQILDDKYILVKKIGSGITAKVKLGYSKSDGTEVAVKIMKISSSSKGINIQSKYFHNEINMIKKIKHLNVINLLDASNGIITKPNGKIKHIDYLVFEYASNGELFDYIYFPSKGFDEQISRNIFKQIIDGLETCHISGVAHRDLKTENIILDQNWVVKIADFGYATLLNGKLGNGLLETQIGTTSYAAPEILSRKQYNGIHTDIFSCGVILFVLVTGKLPFGKAFIGDVFYRNFIKKDFESFWKNMSKKICSVSDEFKSLINSIFSYDPQLRPSINDIRKHPWMNLQTASDIEVKQELERRKATVSEMKNEH